MVVAHPIRGAVRPACPHHPGSPVRLDGHVRSAWSEAHRQPRQWRITHVHDRLPRSSVEGKIVEWLAPLRRRAGGWQNVRRFNLVLGLMTLHDRDGASKPRLVRESEKRTRRRATDDHLRWLRGRLTPHLCRRERAAHPIQHRGPAPRPTQATNGARGGVGQGQGRRRLSGSPRRMGLGRKRRSGSSGAAASAPITSGRPGSRTGRPSHRCARTTWASGFIRPSRWPLTSRGSPTSGIRPRTSCAPTGSPEARASRSSSAASKATSGWPSPMPGRSRAAAVRPVTGSKPPSGSRPARGALARIRDERAAVRLAALLLHEPADENL